MWDDYLGEVVRTITPADDRQACRAELEEHLDDLYQAARARGLEDEAARREALASFGPAPLLARAWSHSLQAPPVWPVPVWLVGVVLVFVPLTPGPRWTGPAGGSSAWFAIWAVVWAMGHWPSFYQVGARLRHRERLVPPRRAVRAAWRRAWAFVLYGGAVGWFTIRLFPAFHTSSGPLWPLFAVGLIGLFACAWTAGPSTYPVGAGVAVAAAWLVMVGGWTLHPLWMPPLWVGPMTAVALATLLAGVFFTLQGWLVGAVWQRRPEWLRNPGLPWPAAHHD